MRGHEHSADRTGSATAIFLPKGFSTPHENLTMIFGGDSYRRKLNGQPQPHLQTMLSPRGPLVITFIPGASPALFGVACHYPPLKCTVLEFYGRIFHPLQFLSPIEVLHTLQRVTGLPCYFHSLLSGHSFVVALLPMAPLLSLKPPLPRPAWT